MARRIAIYPEMCIGCRLCSVACTIAKTKEAGLSGARIWVCHFGEESKYVPVTCTHCDEAWCMEACPTDAISRDPVSHVTRVDTERCVGCRMCTMACPFGAVTYHVVTGKAIKCDECDGDPACVTFCPTGAIAYVEEGAPQHRRRMELAKRLLATAE